MKRPNLPKVFKVFASQKRIAIVELLLNNKKGLYLSMISRKLNLPVVTIERHILMLRDIGLIESKRQGNRMIYKVSSEKTNFINRFITTATQI